uniref:AAA+ ATPase domain-containing protein n=1 Tax=Biomphalaria glabrata TaxID=6526 RepID=A0A2C9L0Y5_BIOGL
MMAETNGPLQNSNPLFIRGDVGLGKTHLMHAAGWYIKKINPNRKVVYLSAEKFMYQFITSLRNKDIFNFKEYFRSADVFMVDDVQFIGGKESTQEEFFHTFNELINSNKQLVFSADRPPCELKTIEERIRSRLNCGLVVGINATTFELRLGILQSKVNDMNMCFSNDILEYLAANINSNVRELEGALNRIIAYSKYNNAEITIDMARSILSDMISSSNR